jgi:hypothetical protein
MSPMLKARLASRGWAGARVPEVRTEHLPVEPQQAPPRASPALPAPLLPPAGWYSAPDGGFERWWDGEAWSEHVRYLQDFTG